MDHYIPKRRVPVTLWSGSLPAVQGQLFLDLDPDGRHHPTVLDQLNLSARFLPVAVGDEGRIHLYHKSHLSRVTLGRGVIQSDIYARGFHPWREEECEVRLADQTMLTGRVWTPLERATQRLSDFMNRQGDTFFVLHTATGVHLVNATAVVEMRLAESAGAPLALSITGNAIEP
jgi:hypothetical protein